MVLSLRLGNPTQLFPSCHMASGQMCQYSVRLKDRFRSRWTAGATAAPSCPGHRRLWSCSDPGHMIYPAVLSHWVRVKAVVRFSLTCVAATGVRYFVWRQCFLCPAVQEKKTQTPAGTNSRDCRLVIVI